MKILLDSDLQELARARRFVFDSARRLTNKKMPEESIFKLQLALTEVITNIVKHSYHNEKGNRIEVVAESFANGIQLIIHHWGESFEPASIPPPVFDGSSESGFGLYIISKCVDFVGYSTDKKNRNTLRLIKK